MLFHVTYKPKSTITHEDQKAALELWNHFTIPDGFEIKSWYVAPDNTGYVVLEAASPEVIFAAVAPWSAVYHDYSVVPVIDAETAIKKLQEAIKYRESL